MSRGFTLIEVIVAVGVFAIGLVAVITLFAPLARSTGDSADLVAAGRVADALALKLKSEPISTVAALLKNSIPGGHQLLEEDNNPNGYPGRSDGQVLFASRDGVKIGTYGDPIWREAGSSSNPDREKFFEIALIRNEALSPMGSEADPASPYLAYTARLRWPAFVPDRGIGAIEIGAIPAGTGQSDLSLQRAMFFAGVISR